MSDDVIGIRDMRVDDLERVRAWRNHPEVRRFMYSRHEISADEHRRWFEQACAESFRYLWLVERQGRSVGLVNLTIKDEVAHRATWGFYLAPDAPRGSGSIMGRLALERAFTDLEVHKVWGEALAGNERSIRFHERLGFRREALFRDHFFDGRGYQDVFGFGLLAADWRRQVDEGRKTHD